MTTSAPPTDAPIDPTAYAWPHVSLDAVDRMRALAAAMPHVALDEAVFDVPFPRLWSYIDDLDHSTLRSVAGMLSQFRSRVEAERRDEARFRSEELLSDFAAELAEATVAAKRFMTDRQRELSRTVVPLIQTTMTPGYQAGAAESGTGSGARRVAVVEGARGHLR